MIEEGSQPAVAPQWWECATLDQDCQCHQEQPNPNTHVHIIKSPKKKDRK